MKKIPFTNKNPHAVTIGTTTIGPGDTRSVDASLVGVSAAKPKAAAPEDPVEEFLKLNAGPAKDAVAGLPDDVLRAVAEREERKTVLPLLEQEKIRRAETASAIVELSTLSDEQLEGAIEGEDRPAVLDAIEAEQARRQENSGKSDEDESED